MNNEKLESYDSPQNEELSTSKKVLAFAPVKTYSMKCNIKGTGFKPKTLKFLVQAEDYISAKTITEDFVKTHINQKLYVASVIGSEIVHEYLLKEAIPVTQNEKTH